MAKSEQSNVNPSTAIVTHDRFGEKQVAVVRETASGAMAAMAKAAVEARSIMAMNNPRNLDTVRSSLLKECQRPSFASVARYKKPIGQGVEGFSVRFVEQALQTLGNCESSATTVYDDDSKRIVEVRVTDYERNVCHSKQVTVSKTVERRSLRKNQTPISSRTNSGGQTVYTVQASDDDLLNKEAALVSKALRTCGLRLIPGWLQDEAEKQVRATLSDRSAADPDAERRVLLDSFGKLNVSPADLSEYLGHDVAKMSPSQTQDLRKVFVALRDGQAAWIDVIENRRELLGTESTTPAKGTGGVKDKLKAKLDEKAKKKEAPFDPKTGEVYQDPNEIF